MPKCKFCGQEVAKKDFEDDFEICIDCIMTDSMSYGVKHTFFMCLFVLGGSIFIVSLFSVIANIPLLFSDFEHNFVYIIPPLIVSIISGSFVILSFIFSKFKFTKERQTPEYTLTSFDESI